MSMGDWGSLLKGKYQKGLWRAQVQGVPLGHLKSQVPGLEPQHAMDSSPRYTALVLRSAGQCSVQGITDTAYNELHGHG